MTQKKETFLDTVCEQIKFKHDRKSVRQEMSDHIDDAEEFYGEDVYSNLGDPVEIGEALNAIHHPLIGRLWLLSKVLLVFAVALFLF